MVLFAIFIITDHFDKIAQLFLKSHMQGDSHTQRWVCKQAPFNLSHNSESCTMTQASVHPLPGRGPCHTLEQGQRQEGCRAALQGSRACFLFLASDLGVSPGIYSAPQASCWPELSSCDLWAEPACPDGIRLQEMFLLCCFFQALLLGRGEC